MTDDLQPLVVTVCGYCRAGAGGECHTPGCAFCRSTAPDLPLTAALSRDEMVEAAAVAMASEFGYEWVFTSDTTDENYDAAYWRHVSAKALTAAGVVAAEIPA